MSDAISEDIINVTKTFLPPQEEYERYLKEIWKSGLITNQGPLLKDFEEKAKDYLKVENFHFVSNGTIALQIALNSLGILGGEVITTPFSYVATTSSILWERCKPVFVDIESKTFCIDAEKIEAAITSKTRAIMAVHVFGYPCDVEKIESLAKEHNLKVIYDAAHAFGVEYNGRSLLSYGDISTCSFHATKVFHTIEGGAVIVRDKEISEKVELTKRFGHAGDEHIGLGINAKASEFQAAMGLCNLNHVDDIIADRRKSSELYDRLLGNNSELNTRLSKLRHNYAYYPLVLEDELQLLKILSLLNSQNIYPRRYFYPSLNKLPYIDEAQPCPVSEDISIRILCLPLYYGLKREVIELICKTIVNNRAV